MNGLKLLLLFSYGAALKGLCGDRNFVKKIEEFVEGERTDQEMRAEIREKLKIAWPFLRLMSGRKNDPLKLANVRRYVFLAHNQFVMKGSGCEVLAAKILTINEKKRIAMVEMNKKETTVRFFRQPDLSKGQWVAVHQGWVICKISRSQRKMIRSGLLDQTMGLG